MPDTFNYTIPTCEDCKNRYKTTHVIDGIEKIKCKLNKELHNTNYTCPNAQFWWE